MLFQLYVVFALLVLTPTRAIYLPGTAPVNYCIAGEDLPKLCKPQIPLYVNRLNSEWSAIPYEYHHFDFCTSDESQSPAESLGQIIFGERIRPSQYKLEFLKNVDCKALCTKTYHGSDADSQKRLNLLRKGMALSYQHHWIVDNIPVTLCYPVNDGDKTYCTTGFPMGCQMHEDMDMCIPITDVPSLHIGAYYLFNHVDLEIMYHSGDHESWGVEFRNSGGRIISVKVKPASIQHANPNKLDCNARDVPLEVPTKLGADKTFNITYTYRVTFIKNNTITWSSRWDYMLESMPQSNIQWFSVLNTLVIVLVLSGMVAMILLRTLYKDIATYNQLESGEDVQEEFGWKLLHGDVFRPPRWGMLLAVLLGSGTQVFGMTLVTLTFHIDQGFLSPTNRGTMITYALVAWVLLGAAAGYVSARIYKSFGGRRWKSNILLTSMVCPGVVFSLYCVMNLVLWDESSSASVPFSTLMSLLALWFCISVPLTVIGAFFGFRKRVLEHPVRTNQIPRQIPDQSLYTQPVTGIVMGGVLPFGCIFVQLFFILNSLWTSQVYHMFGFLFLVFLILIITCSETTILLCYFHLCAEDYNWWWRAFLTSGSAAGYFFVYCCYYFATKLSLDGLTSTFLYFGYTLIMVFLFFLLTGTIGFMACFWFLRKIYSVVKVD